MEKEIFTNRMTGSAFAEQNGPLTIKRNEAGKCFFISKRATNVAPQGYISDKAMPIIDGAMAEGKTLKEAICLLQFAVTHYEDSEGNECSLPTLMPQASGEMLYDSTEEEW